MDSIDNFRERFETLEQQMKVMGAYTRTVERRLRWWRGIACGVIVLALVGFPLQSGKAQYEGKELAQRVAELEYKLQYVTGGPQELVITGANLRIVNGLGQTNCRDEFNNPIPDCPNGLGNLIVGYNETRAAHPDPCDQAGLPCTDERTGSHNVVVGSFNNFTGTSSAVIGILNAITGPNNLVSGVQNTVNTFFGSSAVIGGVHNTVDDFGSVVIGGRDNSNGGQTSVVVGGTKNTIMSAETSAGNVICGGFKNIIGSVAVNTTITGGIENSIESFDAPGATLSSGNTISGGEGIDLHNAPAGAWAAGSFGGQISGRFRSP